MDKPRSLKSQSLSKEKNPSNPTKAATLALRKQQREAKIQKEFRQHHQNFCDGYFLSLFVDTHNLLHLLYGSADFTRDREYFHKRLMNEGLAFVTNALPELMTGLLDLLEHGSASFPSFKLQRGTNYPRFCRRLFEIVTNEKNYSATSQAAAMDALYNLSTSLKKLRGTPDDVRHQQQYDDFVKVDSELGRIDTDYLYQPELEPIMRSISHQWCDFAAGLDLDSEDCVPRPGPGATVGNVPKHARYAPSVLYKSLDKVFPYESWFQPTPWDTQEVIKSRQYEQLRKDAVEEPHSEYLLVPKTFLKWRGICKEANEVQYLQQALRRQLYARIEDYFSKGIPIRDQQVHRDLALKASVDREDATIDESEASDRIARCLVWHMTELTPKYRDALMAASTKRIKPPPWASNRDLLSVKKFAPMGSAICFPVMSLVHYFLIRAIILTYRTDITIKERQGLCNRVSVYGDDIVLPSCCTSLVYKWLPRFGMKINQTKSFSRSFFRESCGCHAYKGVDITPVYIKYTNFSSTDASEAKKLASLLAAESLHYNRGKFETAKFLRDYVEAKWNLKLPYVSAITPLVGFIRPPFSPDLTDFSELPKSSTSRKWDRWHQSFKYRLLCWSVQTDRGVIPSETEAYLRYLCLGTAPSTSYRWSAKMEFITPFRLDEWIRRVDDKASGLSMSRVSMLSSALVGHSLKGDLMASA